MVETRHRTVIEIGVDDREVRGLGRAMEQAFDPRIIRNFERTIEQATRSLTLLLNKLNEVSRAQGGAGGGGGVGGGVGGGRGAGGGAGGNNAAALNAILGELQGIRSQGGFGRRAAASFTGNYLARPRQMATSIAGGEGMAQGIIAQVPLVGGVLSAMMGSLRSYQSRFIAQQQAALQSGGVTGGVAGDPALRAFGITPQQAPGELAQLTQMSGRRGEALRDPGFLESAMGLRFGMGVRQAPSLIGAAEMATNQQVQDPGAFMIEAVTRGVQSGVRAARLDMFLSRIATTTEAMRVSGMPITPMSMITFAQALAGASAAAGTTTGGFRGEAAAAAATTIAQRQASLGEDGSLASLIALQAVGFGEDGVDYTRALMRLEGAEGFTPGQINQNAMGLIRTMAAGNEGAGFQLTRSFLGHGIGRIQSMDMFRGGKRGAIGLDEDARGYVEGEMAAGRGRAGIPAREARFEAARVSMGRAADPAMARMQRMELQVAGRVVGIADDVIRSISARVNSAIAAYVADGLPGLAADLGSATLEMIREMVEALSEATLEALDLTGETPLGGQTPGGGGPRLGEGQRGSHPALRRRFEAGQDPRNEMEQSMWDFWNAEGGGGATSSAADHLDQGARHLSAAGILLREMGALPEGNAAQAIS